MREATTSRIQRCNAYFSHMKLSAGIVIESYYRQFSTDIKIIKYKINPSFDSPEEPKARANKTGINIMIFILIFVENFYNTIRFMIFQYGLELVVQMSFVIM